MKNQTISLEHLKRAAISAHYGISFDPEKRGEQMIKEYEEILQSDLKSIEAADSETKQNYQERFTKYLNAYISAKSRIVSPMISGPSNFPTRRMEKYNRWEDNAYQHFSEFRSKALAGIKKQIQRNKSPEQKTDEAWESIKKSILSSAATIIGIDNGTVRGYTRALFVNSITGLIKRMAVNGQTEHVKRSIELVKEINGKFKKPIITEKNSIFSLLQTAEIAAEVKTELANRESKIFAFEGGEVVINYEADRLQIKHEVKPPFETIANLKTNGFKWSPFNTAWQRQLTNNAIYSCNKLTGLEIPYPN